MYITKVPVTGQDFYGREELLELLLDFAPQEIYFLNGIRYIGKSSVLKEIDRQIKINSQQTSVYFNLRSGTTSEDLGEKLGEQIWQNIQNNAASSKPEWLEKSLTKVILAWVEYCSRQKKKSYLLLDYADRLHELNKDELEELIVAINNKGDFVQLIIAGTRRFFDLEKHSGEKYIKLIDLTTLVKIKIIGMINKEIARKIARKERQEKPVEIDDVHFENIYQQCGGHPCILQEICNSYYAEESHSIHINPNNVFGDDSLNNQFKDNFDLLKHSQQQFLSQLLLPKQLRKDSAPCPEYQIKEMYDLGFLVQDTSNNYHFYSKLFEIWMREHHKYKKIQVVVICALPDDNKYLKQLIDQCLKPLVTATKMFDYWSTENILPSSIRDTEINDKLKSADLVIGLISNKYLTDGEEAYKMHKIAENYSKRFIPVVVKGCLFDHEPYINGRTPLPNIDGTMKPLEVCKPKDKPWIQISLRLTEVMKSIIHQNS